MHDIGRWAYSDEKLAKNEFAASSCEGMGGQLEHEIAKGFSMFHRKDFPVIMSENSKQYIEYNITHQSLAIFTCAV